MPNWNEMVNNCLTLYKEWRLHSLTRTLIKQRALSVNVVMIKYVK